MQNEENQKGQLTNGEFIWLITIMLIVLFAGFVLGGSVVSSLKTSQVSNNETYLYNLVYSQGHNDAISNFPIQPFEPSITESDVMSQIVDALGTADKIDLQVHGDKETGKASISLNIEFTQPTEQGEGR